MTISVSNKWQLYLLRHLKIEVHYVNITLCSPTPSVHVFTGMCMCAAMHMDPASCMVYVFGGFEDGSVVLWDGRFSHKELASIKLFPEPGTPNH